MTIEQCVLALQLEGFCVQQGVIPADEVAAVRKSVEATLDAAGGRIEGSTFINHNQALAPYLGDQRVLGVAQAVFGPHTRIGATSALMQEPNPDAGPSKPGNYHVDWPFGQGIGSYVPAPIPNITMNLPSFFMLTDFTQENGATIVVPGSHRSKQNPNGDPSLSYARQSEIQVTAPAGSVLIFDGRLWHKGGSNYSRGRRLFCGISYVPWWLNCHARRPNCVEHRIQKDAGYQPTGHWPFVKAEVFDKLPDHVKPLFRHWVDRDWQKDAHE